MKKNGAEASDTLKYFSERIPATFVYAGIQKLSDPGFLHPGAPTYIGTQLHGFANVETRAAVSSTEHPAIEIGDDRGTDSRSDRRPDAPDGLRVHGRPVVWHLGQPLHLVFHEGARPRRVRPRHLAGGRFSDGHGRDAVVRAGAR